MTNLTYLPYIIPATLVIYFLVVVLVVYLYSLQETHRAKIALSAPLAFQTNKRTLFEMYFGVLPPQFTYGSLNTYGGNVLLLCTRVMSFCYIFGLPGLWNFIRNDWDNLYFFTLWNIIMISVYYSMAIISSVIGLLYHQDFLANTTVGIENSWMAVEAPASGDKAYWSAHFHRLSFCMQILFQVAGASALFVTVIAFSFLNPVFDFWNVSAHLVTSLTFITEMSQNSLIVRWHHVVLNMGWAVIYLIYIWPAVASGEITDWPYGFLETENAGCFGWYFALFFFNVIFYFIWYYLSRAKYELIYVNSEAAGAVMSLHLRGTGRGSISSVVGPRSVNGDDSSSNSISRSGSMIDETDNPYRHMASTGYVRSSASMTGSGASSGSDKLAPLQKACEIPRA
eukprot:gene7724-9232_t